jgi:CheY-like chemotaxis protein
MKRTMTTLGALMAMATPAIAAGATETEGTSMITILLIGFGGLIVVGQLIPAFFLLRGMVKGLFGKSATKTELVADHK